MPSRCEPAHARSHGQWSGSRGGALEHQSAPSNGQAFSDAPGHLAVKRWMRKIFLLRERIHFHVAVCGSSNSERNSGLLPDRGTARYLTTSGCSIVCLAGNVERPRSATPLPPSNQPYGCQESLGWSLRKASDLMMLETDCCLRCLLA